MNPLNLAQVDHHRARGAAPPGARCICTKSKSPESRLTCGKNDGRQYFRDRKFGLAGSPRQSQDVFVQEVLLTQRVVV